MFEVEKSIATPGPRVVFNVPCIVRCKIYVPANRPVLDHLLAFDYRYLPAQLEASYPELFEEKQRVRVPEPSSGNSVACAVAMANSAPPVFFEGHRPKMTSLVDEALMRNLTLDNALIGAPATLVCRPVRLSTGEVSARLGHEKQVLKPKERRVFLALCGVKVNINDVGFETFEDFLDTEEHELTHFQNEGLDL